MTGVLPGGWKTVPLENILSRDQRKEIDDFVKAKGRERKKIVDCTVELKGIMNKWHDQLLEKGVDSNFLAYAIAAQYLKRGL